MLVRDLRRPTCIALRYDMGATISEYCSNNTLGSYQSISSLNDFGRFVPGEFRANPVVIEKMLMTSTPGVAKQPASAYGHTCGLEGHVAAGCISSYNLLAQAQSRSSWDVQKADWALNKAHAKCMSPDLDVGTIIGELKETVAGIAQPLSALRKYLKLYSRLQRSSAAVKLSARLNMLTGSWLEFRYGIMPLIGTIQDIISEVEKQNELFSKALLRKRGSVKWSRSDYLPTGWNQGLFTFTSDTRFKCEHKTTSVVAYTLTSPLTFGQRYGLDLNSIPSVAYELLTLSFVVDWFWAFGDWLRNILADSSNRIILGSTTSQKSTITIETNLTSALFYNKGRTDISSSHMAVYQRLDRRVNQTLPVIPPVNLELLNLKRTIDSISLIWQKLPKPKR